MRALRKMQDMSNAETIKVKGVKHTVEDREEPGPNMKVASPQVREILYLRSARDTYSMAYRFSDGEVRIAVRA